MDKDENTEASVMGSGEQVGAQKVEASFLSPAATGLVWYIYLTEDDGVFIHQAETDQNIARENIEKKVASELGKVVKGELFRHVINTSHVKTTSYGTVSKVGQRP